jgi:uncharacterized protein
MKDKALISVTAVGIAACAVMLWQSVGAQSPAARSAPSAAGPAAPVLSPPIATPSSAPPSGSPASPGAPGHSAPGEVSPLSSFKPLQELPGVVSWKTLTQVQTTQQSGKVTPQFAASVEALNTKDIKIQGFMMPLEAGERQKHFILSSWPPTCSFCMPGGPESVVEVRMKRPVKYTLEPLVLSGRFAVLKSDPTGLYYRLTDAAEAKAD